MDLRGRVALVTGGGCRVGRALALALGERGASVAIHYNTSGTGARETAERIARSGKGNRADVFQADLTLAEAPARLIGSVVSRFGQLDVLVNSAAVMLRTPLSEVDQRTWDQMFALNLRAPFFLAQAAAPHLRNARGVIINIADLAAFETWPAYVPHGLTKSGVVHMTKSLARVLAPEIRVNAIAPGTVLLPDKWSEADSARLAETTPLQRIGSPEDVASAMLFLISAEYITGETVIVDGGRHVRR